MPDKVDWGEALKGAGAWFAGKGPQYELVKQQEAEALREQDLQAGIRATVKARTLLSSPEFMSALPDLLGEAQQTMSPQAFERYAQDFQGDPQSIAAAINNNFNEAVSLGHISVPKQEQFQMGETGRMVKTDDGYARSIPRFNQKTGEIEEVLIPVNGAPVNDLGLTSDEMIAYTGDKSRASEGAKDAVGLSTKFTEQASGVRQVLPKYDEIVSLIDEGAGVGPIRNMLPSLKPASIALDALQKDLGIAVINSATFGALSKDELNLALEVAVPQKMKPEDLREWAINKKAAQSKLVDYLDWASGVLGQSGMTPSNFSRMVRSGDLAPPSLGVSDEASKPQIKILNIR